jgi:[ribosomal protein S5]-alanine N-acetyltransferase
MQKESHNKRTCKVKLKRVTLRTNRLELEAATFDHISAEMESSEHLARLLGTRVEPGWPPGEYDRDAQDFFGCRLREEGMSVVGWYVWYAVRREEEDQPSMLVGAGGYFGPPNEKGEVEIGFSMMPSSQGHGYATEMANALVSNAFADIRVHRIIAHTPPDNLASVKVLTKSGFRCVHQDQESGNDLFEILRN